jgi:ketosteroid isomerase-like protein
MSEEESTAPDLVELTRRFVEAAGNTVSLSFLAPDAVWDMAPYGMGTYEGLGAIRAFFEDWLDAFEEFAAELEEVLDLGNGVVFSVVVQGGRPRGSGGVIRVRYAAVVVWAKGLVERFTSYGDFDEARAAAERLARERG